MAPPRKQAETEKTNIFLQSWKAPVYSKKEAFEQKYGVSVSEFEKELHARKGGEDFAKEEDLEDWEFVCRALTWWEDKLRVLQNV